GVVAEEIRKCEILGEPIKVDRGRQCPVRQQSFDFGCEQRRVVHTRIVKRLDPIAVASKQKAALLPVPNRECEHTVETLNGAGTPFSEGLDHDLGVGGRLEMIAKRQQLFPQFLEIIYFSVVRNDESAIRTDHRLGRGGAEIDDCKAAMAEPDGTLRPVTVAVGTAVRQHAAHPLQYGEGGGATVRIEVAGDATHRSQSLRAIMEMPASSTFSCSTTSFNSPHQRRTSSTLCRCAFFGAYQSKLIWFISSIVISGR